jgi:hypothetical protein
VVLEIEILDLQLVDQLLTQMMIDITIQNVNKTTLSQNLTKQKLII